MLDMALYNQTSAIIPKKLFVSLLPRTESLLVQEGKIGKQRTFSFEFTFVGLKTMRTLNRLFHKKDKPTDVISLSFFEHEMPDPFLGEIFICVPYAALQAKRIGQSLQDELRFLFVHGLLHLFGYDHKKPQDEAHMKNLTYRILGRKQI